ncbi:MAG: nucleoside-diphosphate sugar epimerase/dehydratase [Anaeromyxobacteraceae bacterium]
MTERGAVILNVATRRTVVIVAHLVLWTAALACAFLLRFEFRVQASLVAQVLVWLPLLLAIRVASFYALSLFRGIWRYTSAHDAIQIFKATTLGTLVFTVFLVFFFQTFPRSVVIIDWVLAMAFVGGARFSIRALRPPNAPVTNKDEKPIRVLIVGAGDAGEMLVREIQRKYAGRYEVVGFVDDDRMKLGGHIHGVRVRGFIEELPRVVADQEVDEILIAIPTATSAQMRRMVELCKQTGAKSKTIPGLGDLVDGQVTFSQLRPVAIEDLLGRDPVALDMALISREMKGHAILVSGAGGSIGSELCRQVARFEPSVLILVERAENALFHIHRELTARFPALRLEPRLADITDLARMEQIFEAHRPTIVVHAAAHKHVPMIEWNPCEAVTNNVLGTKALADLADRHGVERFVMVSTDKAVNPTSVMGTSKRVAEIYVQALSQRSKTRFVTVRFGNVLGSNGSVIPIFQEQIARGGPVTVTHPDMRRYFMTIPEASQLVLQAGAMGNGGEIFVLDMGEPVKIADLARDLITLTGLKPGEDIEIKFTGLRPGEKLFEELSVSAEHAEKTRHPKIFVGHLRPCDWDALQVQLDDLTKTPASDCAAIRAQLKRIVPEYTPDGGAKA